MNYRISNIYVSTYILFLIVFLLAFLFTGIFQQRITDIVAFFISAVMLTIYVVAHYVIKRGSEDKRGTNETTRLVSSMTCSDI